MGRLVLVTRAGIPKAGQDRQLPWEQGSNGANNGCRVEHPFYRMC